MMRIVMKRFVGASPPRSNPQSPVGRHRPVTGRRHAGRMKRRSAACAILVLCALAATPVFADDAPVADPAATSLAKTFLKMCILALPNLERVTLTAKLEGWRKVEGPAHDEVFLSTSAPTQTTWLTRGVDDLPVAVTIARKGSGNVKSMHVTCAVQNPDASAPAVAKALDGLLTLPSAEPPVSEGTERITTWQYAYGNRTVGIGLVTDTKDKAGAILSAVNVQNAP